MNYILKLLGIKGRGGVLVQGVPVEQFREALSGVSHLRGTPELEHLHTMLAHEIMAKQSEASTPEGTDRETMFALGGAAALAQFKLLLAEQTKK